jgi:hypothetical protein
MDSKQTTRLFYTDRATGKQDVVEVMRESRVRGVVSASNCGFAPNSVVELPDDRAGRWTGWREAGWVHGNRTAVTPGGLKLLKCVPNCGHADCEGVQKKIAVDDALETIARMTEPPVVTHPDPRVAKIYRRVHARSVSVGDLLRLYWRGVSRLRERGILRSRPVRA